MNDIVKRARALRPIVEQAAESLPDAMATEAPELYPEWREGVEYGADKRVRYDGVLYKVLTPHTSQSDWKPDVSPSLFAKVLIPDTEVIPAWERPDSTNTYGIGDKVTHNGKTWVSIAENNSWEPGVYGWDEVT